MNFEATSNTWEYTSDYAKKILLYNLFCAMCVCVVYNVSNFIKVTNADKIKTSRKKLRKTYRNIFELNWLVFHAPRHIVNKINFQ